MKSLHLTSCRTMLCIHVFTSTDLSPFLHAFARLTPATIISWHRCVRVQLKLLLYITYYLWTDRVTVLYHDLTPLLCPRRRPKALLLIRMLCSPFRVRFTVYPVQLPFIPASLRVLVPPAIFIRRPVSTHINPPIVYTRFCTMLSAL